MIIERRRSRRKKIIENQDLPYLAASHRSKSEKK